jgi:hypothetical protein
MSIKNSNDTVENRTRDLPACNTVPQPTAPLRAPFVYVPPLKFQQRNWSLQICVHNILLFKITLYVSFQYPNNGTKMTTEVEARTSE